MITSVSDRLNIFDRVADGREILLKSLLADNYRAAAVVRVKTQRLRIFEPAIEKQDNMVFGVVDQPERTDTAGLQPQVSQHSFGRGEGEFARGFLALRDEHLFQPMLDVMNSQIIIAREANEVMLVALVVAHEDVLAMHATVSVPPPFGFLDGFALGVVVGGEGNMVLQQVFQHLLLARRDDFVISGHNSANQRVGQ